MSSSTFKTALCAIDGPWGHATQRVVAWMSFRCLDATDYHLRVFVAFIEGYLDGFGFVFKRPALVSACLLFCRANPMTA